MTKNHLNIFVCCNYIDEYIYSSRKLSYRNSAASKKLLGFSNCINSGNSCSSLISLGRAPSKSTKYYHPTLCLHLGISTIHVASFLNIQYLSHIFSALQMLRLIFKLRTSNTVILFYNYQIHYLPSIIYCWLVRLPSYMIVDDDIPDFCLSNIRSCAVVSFQNLIRGLYDLLTGRKLITAYSSFRLGKTTHKEFLPYYTSVDFLNPISPKNYHDRPLRILFSGTINKDSGLQVFANLLILIGADRQLSSKVEFFLTGSLFLDSAPIDIRKIPNVNVHILNDMSSENYSDIANSCDIGLSLKMPNTIYGDYTFPSKIFDYISRGLAVISTDISDVRSIFGDSLLFIDNCATPYEAQLCQYLQNLVSNPEIINDYVCKSRLTLTQNFSSTLVADKIINYLATS